MAKCKICRKNIEAENLEYTFQFTFGNIKKGNFRGKRSSYYHPDCLNNKYMNEVKFPVPDI